MGVCLCKNQVKKSKSLNIQHIPNLSTNTLNCKADDLVSPKNKLSSSLSDVTLNEEKEVKRKEIKDQSIKNSPRLSASELAQAQNEKEEKEDNKADQVNRKAIETQLNSNLETNPLIKETTFDRLLNQTVNQEPPFESKLFAFSSEPKEYESFIFMNELHITNQKDFSSEYEFNLLIQSYTKQNQVLLVSKLLNLNERQWNKELIILSDLIKENREAMDSYIMNKYLRNQMSIVEHFNWITWALSYYYNYAFLSQKSNWFSVNEACLPNIDSIEWINGFEWKGLYVRVQPREKSKALLNEIKALNYVFFDYIQLIDTQKTKQASLLSNELIFPLISYAEIGGMILFATPCIVKFNYDYEIGTFEEEKAFNLPSMKDRENSGDVFPPMKQEVNKAMNKSYMPVSKKYTPEQKSRMSLGNHYRPSKNKNLIESNGYSNIEADSIRSMMFSNVVNEDIDISKYSLDDLQESRILKRVKESNLIKVINELSPHLKKNQFKLMLVNAVDLIPNLFANESKSEAQAEGKYNFISFDEQTRARKQVSINKQSNKQLKDVLENDYGVPYSPLLCVYENIYSSFQYKILFSHNEHNSSSKVANDFLVNLLFKQNDSLACAIKSSSEIKSMFNLTSLDLNISNPYAMLYSFRYPIKQKYSLIHACKDSKNNNNATNHSTCFTKHFDLFCSKLNKRSSLIRTTHHLKEFFHRYGINTSLQIFTLPKIKNATMSALIKISVFTNAIKDFFSFHESSNLIMKMFLYEATHDIDYLRNTPFNFHQAKDLQTQSFIRREYTINEIRKEKILYLIKSILYPSEVTNEKYTAFVYEQLSFFLLLKTLKWKLIDEALQFEHNTLFEVNDLLKEFTMISRQYPFIFLTSLEEALDVVIAPFTKFKSSFSLHSMANNTLKIEDLILNDPVVTSYIRPKEISGYILAKCTTISNSFNENNELEIQSRHKADLPVNALKSISTRINIQQYALNHNDMSRNGSFRMNSNNITNINQINDNSVFRTVNKNKSILLDNNICNTSQINKKELEGSCFSWKDIADNFLMTMPSICYKLLYQHEEGSTLKTKTMHKYLSHCYSVTQYDCISDWKNSMEALFNGVSSSNGECEQSLLKIYTITFIHAFYVEKNINQAKETFGKMKEIMKAAQMFTFNDCAIINLFNGLVTEKYIDSEEYYSKSLIFTLFQYGDPRGRRSQGHFGMMYPLWKIARQTCALENSLTNENFKEMFHCLNDIIQSQGRALNDCNDCNDDDECNNVFYNKSNNRNYSQSRHLFKSDTVTKETTAKEMKNGHQINVESNHFNDNSVQGELNECSLAEGCINSDNSQDGNCCLSQAIFDKEDKYLIKPFPFPPTSDLKCSYLKMFLCKEYTLYILKAIMGMIDDRGCLVTEDLLDIISMNFISQIRENANTIGSNISLVGLKKKNGTVLSHYIFNELMEKMSFKQNIPERIMVSFGKNSYNETTHDNYDILTLPRVAYKLKEVEVKQIIGGWEHNFIIDKKGKCYGWGRNQHGQCGVGRSGISHEIIIRNPRRVIFDKEVQIKKISSGNEHSLFLTTKGEVYACGNSEDGVIGVTQKTLQLIPAKINELCDIVSIACGTIHNLALDKEGSVYSWGSSRGGQLGLNAQYVSSSGNSIYLAKPTKITELPQKIVHISAGEAHSIALSAKGAVYGWGFNSNGQLGIGFCEDSFEAGAGLIKSKVSQPHLIDTLPRIDSVQCGKIFTMFISNEKEIFACGGNDVNQLGIEDLPPRDHLYDKRVRCFDFVLPTPIEAFFSMKVLKVACGESHCLAIINDPTGQIQNVWGWGNNRFGQLGIGKHFKSSQPRPINYLLSYYNSQIEDISCGGYHSLCLLKSKGENNQQIDEDIILNVIKLTSF